MDVAIELVGGPLDGSTTSFSPTSSDGGPALLISFHHWPEGAADFTEIMYERQPRPDYRGVWRYRFLKGTP